ncbi:MAG: YqjF family protein [Acidobacteriaceae bacterium]
MIQRWNDLLFAHWPVPAAELAYLLPAGLQVDTFDGWAWVGVVPFWMDRVQLRGLPAIPGASRFPELNLRTYVRSQSTRVPGVYFFSLDAANPVAVAVARARFHLPYYWARMSVEEKPDGLIHYSSRRLLSPCPVRFKAQYRGMGRFAAGSVAIRSDAIHPDNLRSFPSGLPDALPNGLSKAGPGVPPSRTTLRSKPGSIEHFLTERYCLFTSQGTGWGWGRRSDKSSGKEKLLVGNIHHTPWPLEEAEGEIEINELPAAHGIVLPDRPPILHYSRELAVYVWDLEPVLAV